ncbi:MAG: PIN domain-containing protein [Verrucomicrobiales bacterium]|nr:PIN domain-containing protein [Verrucomicrobiales bacterium]
MNSLDTNILVYAANRGAPEHGKALAVVQTMLAHPSEWILADHVLWEFYKAQRHPRILERPRSAAQAAAHVRFLREESGVACCAYELPHFAEVLACLEKSRFPYQRTHDAILGITLRLHGVTTFYTRNEADFAGLGLHSVINPID